MNVSIVDKYVKPFSFYNFDTEMYNISFFASDSDGNWEWYVDKLIFNNEIEAQYEIDQMENVQIQIEKDYCVIL
jgi:hypothetical protein